MTITPLPTVPELVVEPGLLLRRHRPEDVPDIVLQSRDPESRRWTSVPVPYGVADAREFLALVERTWLDGTQAGFAIEYEGRYSGNVDLRLDGHGAAEVGFVLAPWARGKRVMSRSLRLAASPWCTGRPTSVTWPRGRWPSGAGSGSKAPCEG
ncbi:GNAT family N-acetyltransferase [Prauserella cavernicola]|uniref:GNAT family N-acetyltransferase n=1 Tax=Prauserella cavernicola TaxID=2800127 RepID=A0A934QP42_9PSEU|nr:GNAT family N-acetyltransferase [Prauserella cavernicola]MBK1783557.1 GNAT family N-acetyltransferase [Prauserella cavernicola]